MQIFKQSAIKKLKSNKGFQIMELAIVIAVMAMLTMGTFITTELLEHAYERSIIHQLKNIEKSIFMFKITYNELPGDFTKASTALPPHDDNCNHATTTTEKFNGNGNWRIDISEGKGKTYKTESYWAWCHLYLANTGIPHYTPPTDITTNIVPGKHAPKTKRNAVFSLAFLIDFKNIIVIHFPDKTKTTGTNDLTKTAHSNAAFTVKQAKNIIEKIDNKYVFATNNHFKDGKGKEKELVECMKANGDFTSEKGVICLLIQQINV